MKKIHLSKQLLTNLVEQGHPEQTVVKVEQGHPEQTDDYQQQSE